MLFPSEIQLTCGEVVGLCCEDNMSQPLMWQEAAWLCGVLGAQELDFLPLDCTVNTTILDLSSILEFVYPLGPWPSYPHGGRADPGCSSPAVITKLEDIVGIGGCLGTHDGLKQGVGQLLPVHMESALEEPVSAVLTAVRILGGRRQGRNKVISQAWAGLFTSLNNTMSICTQEGTIIKYSINIDFPKQSQDKPRLEHRSST